MVPFTPILESEASQKPVWSQSVAILIWCERSIKSLVSCYLFHTCFRSTQPHIDTWPCSHHPRRTLRSHTDQGCSHQYLYTIHSHHAHVKLIIIYGNKRIHIFTPRKYIRYLLPFPQKISDIQRISKDSFTPN